jgi:hypothetical protein
MMMMMMIIIIIIIIIIKSGVQGAIHDGSQQIRFPILLPPNKFT